MGSPALFIRTQALSANLTTLPSGLWYFFASSYNNSMSYISSFHFVRCSNRHRTTWAALRSERSLFLHHYDYTISYILDVSGMTWQYLRNSCFSHEGRRQKKRLTNGGSGFSPEYIDAFDDGSTRIINTINHRLRDMLEELM